MPFEKNKQYLVDVDTTQTFLQMYALDKLDDMIPGTLTVTVRVTGTCKAKPSISNILKWIF